MRLIHVAALAALIPACTAGGEPWNPGDGTGDSTEDGTDDGTGGSPDGEGPDAGAPGEQEQRPNIQLLLTDAPGDFDEVWVNIASVEIDAGELGWMILTDTPQSFDLLTLQNDVTAALGETSLPLGTYGQLRLIVDGAFVVIDGAQEELTIASGAETGIKIDLSAEVEANMLYTLVIDFDAGQSVRRTGMGWLMTPVIMVKDFSGVPMPEEAQPDAGTEEDPESGDAGTGDEPDADDGEPVPDPVE